MSIARPFIVEPSPHRAGFFRCTFPQTSQQMLAVMRSVVGSLYTDRVWLVPFDRMDHVTKSATSMGLEVRRTPEITVASLQELQAGKGLYPYQKRGVQKAIGQGRAMLNFKPGLGKTPTAIAAMKASGLSSALIVCPAIVRDTWKQEFAKWWPDQAGNLEIVETGKQAEKSSAPFVATSYELMGKVSPRKWGAVILDECHYLKEPKSRRSKEAKALLETQPKDSLRLMLTGTPIANEPIDLHNQVDLLYPNLWGRRDEFARRYCMSRTSSYAWSGREFYGIDPRFAGELEERIGYFAVQATEREVEGLLPPITFQAVRVRPKRTFNVREYLDNFTRRDPHNSKGRDSAIEACGREKLDHTVALVEDALASGSTHVSVMTHLRSTAQEISNALAGLGVEVACVTGDDSHKARHSAIANLAKEPRGVFVATMHSIGIGINELVAFPDVVYAELDYRPDEVVQSMKRYHRISGKKNVRIRVLVLEGTLEERVARSVQRKLKDQEMVLDTGTLAQGLGEALDPAMPDDEFFARVQEAAAKMGERDLYA